MTTFIDAALSDLRSAEALLAKEPGIGGSGFHSALVTGNLEHVKRSLVEFPGIALAKGGPRDGSRFSMFASRDSPAESQIERMIWSKRHTSF